MQVSEKDVRRLADAWLAEVKRLLSAGVCADGCEQLIKTRVRFKPGHDAKLLARYRRDIRAILAAPAD